MDDRGKRSDSHSHDRASNQDSNSSNGDNADFIGNKSRHCRTLSDEDLSEIPKSLTLRKSLSAESEAAENVNDEVAANLNSSNQNEMCRCFCQTVNFNVASASDGNFTSGQSMSMSEESPCGSITYAVNREKPHPDVYSAETVPSSSRERFLRNHIEISELDNNKCFSCQNKSTNDLLGLQVRLLDAINQDDVPAVRHLLHVNKVDPNFVVNLKNPICRATSLGNIQIMQMLLDAGANVNTPNSSDLLWERRPIHIAASKGHLSAMQLLVNNGADINQPDYDHRTPLHWVAMYGQAHMIKWMLDAGAKVNFTQTDGFTPLHTVTCLGHREVCRLFIDGGADMFCRDRDGWTPLHTAVCYGHIDIVTLLLEKGACPLVITGLNGDSTLHLACTKGRLDMAELMLKKGVPIESRNTYGFTPLLTAVFYNRFAVAFDLVKKGANVNAVNFAGTSAINLSAMRCELKLITLLICAGCKVEKQLSLPVSQHSQPLAAHLDYSCQIPQTLSEQCLLVIRQTVAPDLQVKAHLLPLPVPMKRKLVMENLSYPTDILQVSGS